MHVYVVYALTLILMSLAHFMLQLILRLIFRSLSLFLPSYFPL